MTIREESRIFLFRVDAGPQIGLGHLQRCLSLAQALQRHRAECIFLTIGDRFIDERISEFGFQFVPLSSTAGDQQDLESTIVLARERECAGIVVDSYAADKEYLDALRAAEYYLIVIDDLARFAFSCQTLVNAVVHAERLRYRSSTGDTQFLLGPKYALLRSEFWDTPTRSVNDSVGHVLVSVGGTDSYNLTPTILDVLGHLDGEFAITVVLGPFFDNRSAIENAVSLARHRVRLLEAPRSMRDLMLDSDIAVSAAGQTLCELAATGTPAVAIQIADNQTHNLASLSEEGIVLSAGDAKDPDFKSRLTERLKALISDKAARSKMAKLGQGLIDGRGTLRISEAVLAAMTPLSKGA